MTRWVRISQLATEPGLTADQRIGLAATALAELGIYEGLALIHGRERGFQRYIEAGGAVRPDENGDPVIAVEAAGRYADHDQSRVRRARPRRS